MDDASGHIPVLSREVVATLAAAGREVLVDCTVGLGGHAEALLEAAGPQGRLIGIDLDPGNLRRAKERLGRFGDRVRLFQANFSQLEDVLCQAGYSAAEVVLADLGVSSSQLDDPARGLSFSQDGPLDMRMDPQGARTAAEVVNSSSERELADLIYICGEERYSRRIARAIVQARRHGRIERTAQLARIVASAMPAPARRARRGVHPATRTFQALRIAVNDELTSLETLLELLPGLLTPQGRVGIISFHSLEDRRVKQAFAGWARLGVARLLTEKPITPSAQEVAENPRSRSAKFRAAERMR
jgi:16S rRNA (cytosine1402-N4)-methyltransferase